jgi:SAM-dependent methyltransferase
MFADAEAYERFMGRWSRQVAPLLVNFANVPQTGKILDIGSGTGALAQEIAKLRPLTQVVGIDPSEEYIAYAQSKTNSTSRIEFRKGDARKLAFANRTFAAKALREVGRVSQPKARISAAVWDYGDGMRMLRIFWDAATEVDERAQKTDEKHMPLCRKGDLSRLWKEVGLEEIYEQPLTIEMKFNSFSDFWDPFLLGQGPAGAFVRRLEPDRVQALRNTVKGKLSVSSENVAFVLPARVWAVRGTVPIGSV